MPKTMIDKVIVGYMDYIDFVEELGKASDGNKVYPTVEDVLKHRRCAKECGVVEVEVHFCRIVNQPTGE